MKKLFDQTVEIITPCFCGGADQSKAEIRASSIRGELRWWFRVLGGLKEDEQNVFGGISGDEGKSSSVVVRTSDVLLGPEIRLEEKANVNRSDDPFYLLYFAHASGDGIRYEKEGMLPPKTTFRLQILQRRKIDSEILTKALDAFIRLGSIGYRSNRACGALSQVNEQLSFDEFFKWCKTLPNTIEIGWIGQDKAPKFCSDWKSAFCEESRALKTLRKTGYSAGKSGNDPTPFGRSEPRQGSAVRLRPVKLKEGFLPAIIYVPSVLGTACQDSNFSLHKLNLENLTINTNL